MICVIRIKGRVGLKTGIKETLDRLRIRKKYSCIVLPNPTKEQIGMINKVKNFVAFGEISNETFEKLIMKRAQLIEKTKKTDLKKSIVELIKGKSYLELNIKPFFRLAPPLKGIESKKHFGVGKGVLGNHKGKINELLERMI